MGSYHISLTGLGFVHGALGYLHEGELEAITLAQEINADYVLLDDLVARRKAVRLGLPVSSVEISPNITAELNAQGELIGIEILNASHFLRNFVLESV